MKNNNNSGNGFGLAFLAGVLSKQKKLELALRKEEMENKNKFGVADELKKLNDLLKEKLISQDEFDKQRKKLLN